MTFVFVLRPWGLREQTGTDCSIGKPWGLGGVGLRAEGGPAWVAAEKGARRSNSGFSPRQTQQDSGIDQETASGRAVK